MSKAKKVPTKKKDANGYKLAAPLPQGEILQTVNKQKWILGPPLGQGGFGIIYSAKEINDNTDKWPFVIKIEPHGNGPLFVEMHFYTRNCKSDAVEKFMKENKLKSLGLPKFLGSGSHEANGDKYRFLVIEKLGSDIWQLYLENGQKLPGETVFQIAIQILNVLQFIHQCGYIHGDIKGANILLGSNKKTASQQVYLVDFGLASKYFTGSEFKPNKKKAHNGTIEYLSRDAHDGVETRRGDLEILAYNIIQWLGCQLPWEKNLSNPETVQKSKHEYMNTPTNIIKTCFGITPCPKALIDYLQYLNKLDFNSEPDYEKIRNIFVQGVQEYNGSVNAPLKFSSRAGAPSKRRSSIKLSVPVKKKSRISVGSPLKKRVLRPRNPRTVDSESTNGILKNVTSRKKKVEENEQNGFEGYTASMIEVALKAQNKKKKVEKKKTEKPVSSRQKKKSDDVGSSNNKIKTQTNKKVVVNSNIDEPQPSTSKEPDTKQIKRIRKVKK